ncbi:hypothetical protein CLV47_12811 [Antricoccus suffuscus]|uniref:Uncharacterized protein n=1 Tax=Antricoccus suffuscus TaxID=1629062 RepID=A0A2T0Z4W4_9ACTN|nr:hypothetical protein [Antricoccus suffuscus]PRZ31373.1 hypothetical protein CLV47_12811 [Antricoccus suffuscus]
MTQPPYGQPPYDPQHPYGPPPQQPQYGQPQYSQPQYGQPQYGSGGFGGPPPQKKSAMPWIITGAIAVVAVIGVTLALVLTGGKGGKGGGGGGGDQFASDPVAVTTSFMEAAKAGDASEAMKYACGELYDQIKKSGDNPKGTTGMKYTVSQDANINGDKATVDVELKYNMEAGSGNDYNAPGTTTVTVNLEKHSGSWKVCSVK